MQRFGLTSGVLFWPGAEVSSIKPNSFLAYDGSLGNERRLEIARQWLAKHDLVAAYIATLDTVGHRSGPDSDEMDTELQRLDALIGRFLAALDPEINVLIVGDHGMVQVKQRILLDDLLPEWRERLLWADFGPVTSILPKDGGMLPIVYLQMSRRSIARSRQSSRDNRFPLTFTSPVRFPKSMPFATARASLPSLWSRLQYATQSSPHY